MQRWFTPEFRTGQAARVASLRAGLEALAAKPYAAACAAVGGIDFRESNRRIACPALLIAGSRDEATPPALSEDMQAQIPGAQLVRSEEHTSELQSPCNLVCRLLLEKKKHGFECAPVPGPGVAGATPLPCVALSRRSRLDRQTLLPVRALDDCASSVQLIAVRTTPLA